MGVENTIDTEKFPHQGTLLGKQVRVCFDYGNSQTLLGIVVRDDAGEPWRTIIKLDDGRYILSTECQYQPL